MQNWIFSIITPVFSVTWSFRIHYNMLVFYISVTIFHNITVLLLIKLMQPLCKKQKKNHSWAINCKYTIIPNFWPVVKMHQNWTEIGSNCVVHKEQAKYLQHRSQRRTVRGQIEITGTSTQTRLMEENKGNEGKIKGPLLWFCAGVEARETSL